MALLLSLLSMVLLDVVGGVAAAAAADPRWALPLLAKSGGSGVRGDGGRTGRNPAEAGCHQENRDDTVCSYKEHCLQ